MILSPFLSVSKLLKVIIMKISEKKKIEQDRGHSEGLFSKPYLTNENRVIDIVYGIEKE